MVDNKPSKLTKLGLQKLTDIHLHSHTDYEAEQNGDIKQGLYFFCHRIIYFTDRLYQLYESFYCTFRFAGKGNRYNEK